MGGNNPSLINIFNGLLHANVNTPVAAGKIVSVFGELIVKFALESEQ